MSHFYLKKEFDPVATLLETERIQRVLRGSGTLWDFRQALLCCQMNVLIPIIAKKVNESFLRKPEDFRLDVYEAMVSFAAKESDYTSGGRNGL